MAIAVEQLTVNTSSKHCTEILGRGIRQHESINDFFFAVEQAIADEGYDYYQIDPVSGMVTLYADPYNNENIILQQEIDEEEDYYFDPPYTGNYDLD